MIVFIDGHSAARLYADGRLERPTCQDEWADLVRQLRALLLHLEDTLL